MEWNDSPEQAAFRADVRSFVQSRLPAYYQDHDSRRHEDSGLENDWQQDLHNGTPDQQSAAQEWSLALSERGWGQPHWPKEHGGASLSAFDQFILKQEFALARHRRSAGP